MLRTLITLGVLGLGCAGAPAPSPEKPMSSSRPAESARARYEAWLADHPTGAPPTIQTGPKFPGAGATAYELFFVSGGPPGAPKLLAAAASKDAVVTLGDLATGWGAYLRSAEPACLQDQIGWLQGAWASLSPTRPVAQGVLASDPKAKQYVAEPRLEVLPGGGVRFEAWYGEPPQFAPFRYRLDVAASGAATAAVDPLWKLP
jgi:hypothetical protein